jgi:ribosomal protein L7/L12
MLRIEMNVFDGSYVVPKQVIVAVRAMCRHDLRVSAIKYVREQMNYELREAKELADSIAASKALEIYD